MKIKYVLLSALLFTFKAIAFNVSISPGDTYIAVVDNYSSAYSKSGRNTGVGVGFGKQTQSETLFLQSTFNQGGLTVSLDRYTLSILDSNSTDSIAAHYSNGQIEVCSNRTTHNFTCYEGSIFGDDVRYDQFLAVAQLDHIKVFADPTTQPGLYQIPYGIASIQSNFWGIGYWTEIYSDTLTIEVLNRTCTMKNVTNVHLGNVLKNKTRFIDTSLDFLCDSPNLPQGASWSFTEKTTNGGEGVKIELLDSNFNKLEPNFTYSDLNKLNDIKVKTSVAIDAPAGEFSKSYLFTVTYS